MRDLRKFLTIFGFLLTSLLLIFSCDLSVGLGDAVDALPPTMEISNPPLDSIIRDDFLICGTWKDDGTVKSVSITLDRTDEKGSSIKYDGEIVTDPEGKKGTWSVKIEPTSESKPVLDGSYQVTIVAKDGGNHTTTVTRSFKVDNTAPVIVIQRPSSKSSDTSPDSYGQSFTLEGQAADDNNINLIDVEIYRDVEFTQFVHKVSLNNVPNTINLDVAKFVEGEDNDYSTIYGDNTKQGERKLYCKLLAYDDAQRYPVEGAQTEEDKLGNVTSTYYLYEEIATDVLSKYKLPEVYKMFSGTYNLESAGRSATDVPAVKDLLASKVVDKGYFSLNPANNPSFSVTGRDCLKKDGTDFDGTSNNVSSGQSLVIEVSTGLDAIPLDRDSLKVYVQKCDKNGIVSGDKIYISNVKTEKAGTSQKINVVIEKNSNLQIGNYYIIGVEGHDESNNEVVASGTGYGFHFAPSGVAPKIENIKVSINGTEYTSNNLYVSELNPADKSNTKIKLSGNVKSDDPSVALSIKFAEKEWKDNLLVNPKDDATSVDTIWSFEKEFEIVDVLKDSKTSAQYELTFAASVSAENGTTEVSKVVMYDAENPTISIDDFETATKYDSTKEDGTTIPGSYLNGTITIKIRISDDENGTGVAISGDKKAYFEILDKNGNAVGEKHYFEKPAGEVFTINTTELTDKDAMTISIHAWDKAGNKATLDKTFTVDQSTDKPYIGIENTSTLGFAGYENINTLYDGRNSQTSEKKNIISENTAIGINLYDDEGLAGYILSVQSYNVTKEGDVFKLTAGDINTQDKKISGIAKTITYTPSSSGYYQLTIKAYDLNYDSEKTEEENINFVSERTFGLIVTGAAPTVTVTKDKETVTTSAGNITDSAVTSFKNTVEIDSKSGPFTIVRIENKSATEKIEKTLVTGYEGKSYVDAEFIPSANRYGNEVTYKVIDNNNIAGEKTVAYKVDKTAPVVSNLVTPDVTSTEEYTFKADVKDIIPSPNTENESASGVSKVQYKFGENGTVKTNIASTFSQEINFSEAFDSEGEKTIFVRAIDDVGNMSAWESKSFIYDKAAPNLTLANKPNRIGSSLYTLNGVITESHGIVKATSGENTGNYVVTVEEWLGNDKKSSKEVVLSKTDSEYSFSVQLPFDDSLSGDISYKFAAKDESGRELTGTTGFTVNRDIVAPVITITSPSSTKDEYKNVNSYTFKGTLVEENIDIATISLYQDDSTTALKTSEIQLSTPVNNVYTWNWTANELEEGKYKVTVNASDLAGNNAIPVSTSKYVYYDKTVPVIKALSSNLYTGEGVSIAETTELNGTKYYAKSEFTFNFEITEEHYSSENVKLTATRNGSSITAPAMTESSSGSKKWSFTTTPESDGTYIYTISVTDKAGNITTQAYTVIYDATAPEVVMSKPVANGLIGSSDVISGTVTENGCGISAINYVLNHVGTSDEKTGTATISGNTWNIEGLTFNTEGTFTITLTGTDKIGNTVTNPAVTFYYDNAAPVVSETGISDSSKTVNSSYTLSGTVVETNGLDYITIKDGSTVAATLTLGSGYTLTDAETGTYTWTYTPSLVDGTHSYTITATDVTGNSERASNTISRTIYVDTKKPEVTKGTDPDLVELDVSRYVTLTATASDSEQNGYKSGLSGVYYKVQESTTAPEVSLTSEITSDWKALSQGALNWNATVQLKASEYNTDKTIYIYFAAVDQAGNFSISSGYTTVKMDKTQPVVTLYNDSGFTKTVTSSASSPLQKGAADVTTSGGVNSITLYAIITDTNADVLSSTTTGVSIENITDAAFTSGKKYKISMPVDITGTVTSAEFSGNDTNGRNSVETNVYVKCDTVAPVVVLTSPVSTAKINASNTVQIISTVEENNYSSVVAYLLTNSTDTPSSSNPNATANPVKEAEGKYTCTATIPSVADGDYYIAVVAKDTYGNETKTVSDFKYTVDTTKPVVGDLSSTFASFNIAAQSNTSDFVITSTVSDTGSGIETVKIYKDDTEIPSDKVTVSESSGTYSFTINKDQVTNGSNIFKVIAKDNAGNENSKTKTINSDIVAPNVEINGVSPTVTVESTEYVNGKINVSGIASDTTALKAQALKIRIENTTDSNIVYDTIASTPVTVTDLISETSTGSYTLGSTYKTWSFTIDTTKLSDEKTYSITVKAEDTSDNDATSTAVSINVKQATDKPGLSIDSVDTTKATVASLEGANSNILATSGKFTGTVTDDDGIESITVKVLSEAEAAKAVENQTPLYNASILPADKVGVTSYTIDTNLSDLGITAEGGYVVTVVVVDTKKETANSVYTNNTTFALAVDNSIPEISITTANNGYYSSAVAVSGSVSDGSGVLKVQATTLPTDSTNTASSGTYALQADVTLTNQQGTLSDTLDISSLTDTTLNATTGSPESKYSVTYTATDRWGRTNAAILLFYKDSEAPSFDDDNSYVGRDESSYKTATNVETIWYKDTAITIGGQFTDATSGAETVYYWLNPDGTNIVNSDITKASGDFNASRSGTSTTYTYRSTISGFNEGTNNLYLNAVDKAGNKMSNSASYTVHVDKTAPSFTSEYYKYANSSVYSSASGSLLTNKQNAITIYGNISDSASGVGELKISVAGTDKTSKATFTYSTVAISGVEASTFSTWVSTNDKAGSESTFKSYANITDKTTIKSWKIVLPAADISSGAVLVTPPDVAGNGIATQIFTFNTDISAPSVSYTALNDADTSTNGTQVNGKIQLSGSASDNKQISEVTKVQYSIYDSENTKWGDWTDLTAFLDASGTATTTPFTNTSSATNWKTNVINTAAAPFAGSNSGSVRVRFRVIATDAAGNDSVHTYTESSGTISVSDADGNVQEVYIYQDTDRPVIKFTNLTNLGTAADPNYVLKFGDSAKLEGSITDDDGTSESIVSLFVASNEQITAAPVSGTSNWTKSGTAPMEIWTHVISESITTKPNNWSEIYTNYYTNLDCTTAATTTWVSGTYYKKEVTSLNKTTGEYSFIPADTNDGTKTVYFFVKDNNDGVFYTAYASETPAAADALKRPYQQYKTDTKVDNTSAITYDSDSNNPSVQDISIQAYNSSQVSEKVKNDQGQDTTEEKLSVPGTSLVLGGNEKKYAKYIITAYDANEIAGITLDLKYTNSSGNEAHLKLKSTDSTSSEYTDFTESGTAVTSADGNFDAGRAAGSKSPYTKWTTDFIDVSVMKTGTIEGTIMVYDKSGLYGNSFPIFLADNDGPEINITSPAKTTVESGAGQRDVSEEVSGNVSINGSVSDVGNARASTIEWLAPTASERAKTDAEIIALSTWNDTRADASTVANWKFISSFLAQSKDDTTKQYYTSKTDDGVYSIPVYFKSEDTLGNVTLKKDFVITYNPDADKPKSDIAYPSVSDYDAGKTYVTLGGTIRVSGSVNIPSGITTPYGVYIQIADASGSFDDTAKTKAGTGDGNYGYTVVTQSTVATELGKDNLDGFADTTARNAWWGIKANRSSNSWSINLNGDGKMNPSVANSTNNIKIRVCGVNALGKVGNWSDPVTIHIDNNAPSYEGTLYKFEDSFTPTANSEAASYKAKIDAHQTIGEKDYKTGMYLKGNWVLCIRISDEAKVMVDSTGAAKKSVGSVSDDTTYYVTDETTESGRKVRYVYIPVNESATYSLTAYDMESKSSSGVHLIYPAFELNMDNTAPTLTAIKNSSDAAIAGTKVTNSNYMTNFKTNADDGNGSGFKMLAYYFKRSATKTIELPMPKAVSGGWTAGTAYTGIYEGTGALTKDSNLYGVSLTGAITYDSDTQKTTFTAAKVGSTDLTDLSAYPFIRVGSLLKLEGSFYKVTAVSGLAITVDTKLTAKTNASAFAAAAFVVDNTDAEVSTWNNGTNTISLDDGDGVFEFMKKSGTIAALEFGVCADELDDGSIELCCVAFDDAGNYTGQETNGTAQTTSMFLANHTPRLSKVYLATDLNGNGTFSDDELGESTVGGAKVKYFSALTDGGSVQQAVTITNGAANSTTTGLTMRDKLGLAFEFVSGYNSTTHAKTAYEGYGQGNSDIYYKLGVSNAAISTAAAKGQNETLTAIAAMTGKFTGTTGASASALKGFEIPTNTTGLSTYEINASNKANPPLAYINVSLWDSTPGTTPGVGDTTANGVTTYGSQWTVLNIPLNVDVVDEDAPTVTISTPTPYQESSKDKGHVDVVKKADGSGINSSFTSGGSNEFDLDDKVSGKVVFTGTVHDEKRISSLTFSSNKAFNKTAISSKTVGTYSSTYGLVTDSTADTDNDGLYSMELATGVDFEITEQIFSLEDGHTINFTLTVDTSYVGTTSAITYADKDVTFTLVAGNSDDATAETKHPGTGTKQVDIVPYITMVETSLSSIKDSNPSVYDRTSLGHYPVWTHKDSPDESTGTATTSAETIYLYGYNLVGGALKDSASTAHSQNLTSATRPANSDSETFGVSGTVRYSVPVTNMISGNMYVQVNGVKSLNNYNDNTEDANKKANGDNNNNLTDDVVFDVWELNSAAARPLSSGNDVTSVAMAINPSSKMLNFAFANGSVKWSFADGSTNSYQTWKYNWDDFVGSSIFATSDGSTHGTEIGQDTNATRSDNHGETCSLSWVTSRWGTGTTTNAEDEYEGYNSIRLEKLGFNSSDSAQIINKRRIQTPSPYVAIHGTTYNAYIAYADTVNGQIRFRWAVEADTKANTVRNTDSDGQYISSTDITRGQFADMKRKIYDADTNAYSIVAGYGQSLATTATRTLLNDYATGKFVSMDVKEGTSAATDTVVLVWYDATAKKLMYTWKHNPANDNDMNSGSKYGSTEDGTTFTNDGYWSSPIEIFSGAGEYCKIKVDSDGGIHIAAYDVTNADVKYAYLENYYSTTVNTCLVDATDILGTYLTLDVAKVGTKQIPYIGYYANSIQRPKIAKLVTTTSSATAAGVTSNKYTGNWDVSVVPTSSRMVEGTINVGLWKNAGALTYSTTNGSQPVTNGTTNIGTSYSGTGSGVCYGNGTSNAVLAYAITNSSGTGGTIETAQMK